MKTRLLKRRRFLQLAAGGAGLSMFGFNPAIARAQSAGDFRCLVNVFLLGGNDAFNMVVPRSDAEYNVYASSRQNLAIPQSALIPLTPDNPDGAQYGMHPDTQGLATLFDAGDLAVVANIGPLIRPTTKTEYLNGSADLPPQLFSHNDQQSQWQSLKGKSNLTTGWAGRIADIMTPLVDGQILPVNISSAGTVLYQAGASTIPYAITSTGAIEYSAFLDSAQFGAERRAAFEQHLAGAFGNVHGRALAEVHTRSLAKANLVNQALALVPALDTPFPQSPLGAQLQIVARMLAVRDEFEMSRQIFFVATGGFDTHDDQNEDQPGLLSNVSASITAFNAAMHELGLAGDVVLFTQSDFGRTLTSNGDGTDHGWGAHQLVVGGPVSGRRIYGTMPVLAVGGDDDVGGGRIIPTQSADQYAATIARWFGVPDSRLTEIAPHLGNFVVQDLGFLG